MPVAVIKQVALTDPITVYTVHADHLNTPRMILDATNTPVWQWTNRNAFGDNLPNEDPDGDSNLFEYNLLFAGQYYETETKLHYNYYRDYEPATGRYLSSDPIGLAGGLNTYGYALQNPLAYIDPTGEAPPLVLAEIIAKAAVICRPAITAISKLISKLTKKNAPKIDPSKLSHIFGQPRHNLDGLVKQLGSREKAFDAIQKATEAAARSQGFKGNFETTVKIGTENITVRGNIVNGTTKIGTAFKP